MRLRTPSLILTIGLLLLGIVALNVAASRFTPGDGHEQEEATAATGSGNAASKTPSGTAPADANELVEAQRWLATEQVIGPPNAGRKVVVGWAWTPEVQANPARLYRSLRGLEDKNVDAQIRIVNTDIAPDTPPGVSMDGKTIMALPADGFIPEQAILNIIERAPPAEAMSYRR